MGSNRSGRAKRSFLLALLAIVLLSPAYASAEYPAPVLARGGVAKASNPGSDSVGESPLRVAAVNRDEAKAPKSRWITMNFKDVDLDVFIKFISELTGKNFVIDPSVKGRVTIISPEKVTIGEAYQIFLSVLEVNDLTIVPAGAVIKIIKSADARGKGVETLLKSRSRNPDDRVVTQLYALKYANAPELAKLLKPLVPRSGLLIPYPDTNTVIIIDVQSNVDRLLDIIQELDVPGHEEIAVFMLEYARAEKLSKELRDVFEQQKGRRRVGQEELKVIPDERTNSLIVLASPKDMTSIKLLIEQLDRKETKPRTSIHVYTLENAVAEDLAKVLSEIPGKGAEDKKGKAPLISKDVQISADKATNSLVIIAEQDEYEVLEDIIRKLDVPRIMVYVEAVIMEVSADKALQLGVEWRVGNEYDGGYKEGSDGGAWVAQTPGAGELDGLAAGLPPSGFAAGVVGQAITLGDVVFPSVGAFVRAVRSDNDFNVLSTPQILTLDNQEATIEVAQNIPFVTRVDQGTEVTSRAIQSYEYRDVGVTLKVTPQINNNRYVRLEVEQTVSRVLEKTALGGTVLAPTTTKRSTKSTITVKDGETAAIGGLIDENQVRGKTQTPCLGGLPLFGWLFKSVTDRDEKTNLMVFLTPHIVTNYEEGRKLYEKKKGAIEEKYGNYHNNNQPEWLRKKSFE